MFREIRYELYHRSGYHRNGYYGSHLTSLQILEGNDWTGASEIEALIQDAISKEERIQKEKDDNMPSCYCQPSISGGHKGQLISKGNFGVFNSSKKRT